MGIEGSFIPARNGAAYPALPEQERAPDGIAASELDAIGEGQEFTVRWPDSIRALYRGEVEARLFREQHFLFVLGFLGCLATIALDAVINPSMIAEGAILRILTVGPLTVLGLIAAQKGWPRILALCVGACPIAFMGVLAHLSVHLTPQFAASYLTGTALVLAIANFVLPYSVRHVALFALAAIAVPVLVLLLGPVGVIEQRLDYVLLMVVVAAFTVPMAARFEQLRQRNFLLNLRSRVTARELRAANKQLQDLSERDPLTGALNRRGFARVFDERIGMPKDPHDTSRVVLIMVDIDHFKHFNDTHGHQSGDTCLSMVAGAVQGIVHEAGGAVARYGGEEFVAAWREEFRGQAEQVAEDIRHAVSNLLVPVGDEHGPAGRSLVTASVGVGIEEGQARTMNAETSEARRAELIEMADAALYRAKHNGRNRVEMVRRADPIARSA